VFLSIHHNADAGSPARPERDADLLQFSDPDASFDLGQTFTAISREPRDRADRLLPGNYFVVRNAAGAAVLGESSYLTNAAVEFRLALASKQRLEAEAYFLGLVDYFAHGVPRIVATRTEPVLGGGDPVDGSERPWLVALTDRAPGTARLSLDGMPADTVRMEKLSRSTGSWQVRWRPLEPLTDGKHRVEWAVRAAGGNWSNVKRVRSSSTCRSRRPCFRSRRVRAPGGIAGLTLRALVPPRAPADIRAVQRASARQSSIRSRSSRDAGRGAGVRARDRRQPRLHDRREPRVGRPRAAQARARSLRPARPYGARATSLRSHAGRPAGRRRGRARRSADSAFVMTNADGFFALNSFATTPGAERPARDAASGSVAGRCALCRSPAARCSASTRARSGGGGADTTGAVPPP
jgi:hypothetical protein